MRAGAAAYCTKDVQPEKLVNVVKTVQQGSYMIGDQEYSATTLGEWIVAQTEGSMQLYSDPGEPYQPLSTREAEVLYHVTQGLSNKEIAVLLGISHQTVKNHVTAILRKLGVGDRTQAALYAIRRGWVRLHQQKSKDEELDSGG
jgi:DNA-binding NarL/FixJ family response regulator